MTASGLLWGLSLKKRLNILEVNTVRTIMEENPQNAEKILEAMDRIRSSSSFSIPIEKALREARKLYGF
jgi:hypothetical protein